MYNILTLNKISTRGLSKLNKDLYNIKDEAEDDIDGIILRSFKMHDFKFPTSLKAIARAGAGVNNIPIDKCSEKGIVVFNTPGANANAVKELTIASLFLSSRDIIGGAIWAKTLKDKGEEVAALVEKGKSAFVGPEIEGKTLGVIGLGAIGVMVANTALSLGMQVMGYDPFLSVAHAWNLSKNVKKANNLNDIYQNCDYITLHVPLNSDTKYMLSFEQFDNMKKGIRILNFSRGELVDMAAMKSAIEDGIVACYVVDFPSKESLNTDRVISIPHLGASTPESEDNCAVMATTQLADFLENGNITNSVNFPNCSSEREGKCRITIAHKNIPNMLTRFSSFLSECGINIANMTNKSKKDLAYTIMDADSEITEDMAAKISAIDGVLSVRVIK